MENNKKNIYRVFGKIADFIVFPIILISFFSIFITYFATPKNQVPSIFGVSIVKVLTSSMVEAGFMPNDVVFIKQNKIDNLKKGDVIAFYKHEDTADESLRQTLVLKEDFHGEIVKDVNLAGRVSRQNLINSGYVVYFHYVNEVFVAEDGTVFYQTKGSNPNATADGFIRHDYVVGRYKYTPSFIRGFFRFITSSAGMIIFIILPLALLVLFESFNVINKINVFLLEDKLFKRKIEHDDPLLIKFKVFDYMSLPRKAYYYINTPDADRKEVFNLLYGSGFTLYKKYPNLKENALEAEKILKSQGYAPYFLYWAGVCTFSYDKKDAFDLKQKYEKEKILANKNK